MPLTKSEHVWGPCDEISSAYPDIYVCASSSGGWHSLVGFVFSLLCADGFEDIRGGTLI